MAEVKILFEGYSKEENGKVRANCTITLIKSEKNVLVDTGVPGDAEKIIAKLKEEGLTHEDIDIVVYTHGHPDHIGNVGMFPSAKIISFGDVNYRDEFEFFEYNYKINDEIEVIKTPGHTAYDISVIVKILEGIVVVSGDCFENENDNEETELSKPWSHDWESHLKSRKKILELADYIVPGHGKMFKVNK
ncbi:MAG: MBL fold metallo-hydrolase [Candidatus Aenigmarchaeota archaeon]|nr:MBL fold metallo-hydrolase [Candidatus Aenigmarchaeota archaeon]